MNNKINYLASLLTCCIVYTDALAARCTSAGLFSIEKDTVPPSTSTQLLTAGNKWQDYIDLDKYMTPFWKSDTVYDEITQAIKKKGQTKATLLFKADKILTVRSADLKKEFVRGQDWEYKNGKFVVIDHSAIPFFKPEDLLFNVEKQGWSMTGKTKGSFVLFSESTFFASKQISVTYIPKRTSKWKGPVPVFAKEALPATVDKLLNKQPIQIVFFGNSIETGRNSSGFQNISPYMPSWPELIIDRLRKKYDAPISFNNQSVSGQTAHWGRTVTAANVVPQNPDLLIIGFGMNDGSVGVPPQLYREEIKGIIDTVRAANSKAEFILIAPMLANPDAIQSNIQAAYKSELDKLAEKGVVVADMTGVHAALLKYKSYQDMTGNNVNHPNDYLARWYAQFISGLLAGDK